MVDIHISLLGQDVKNYHHEIIFTHSMLLNFPPYRFVGRILVELINFGYTYSIWSTQLRMIQITVVTYGTKTQTVKNVAI